MTFTVDITDMGHGGVGVGRADGRVFFVRGALPGERVEVMETSRSTRFSHGIACDILRASPHRVDHPWQAGSPGATGAADFAHIAPEYQRMLKEHVLRSSLRRIGGERLAEQCAHLDTSVHGLGEDMWHTRTRVDFVKAATGCGMHREYSHDIIALDAMPLAVRELDQLDLFGAAWDDTIPAGQRFRAVMPSIGKPVIACGKKVWRHPGERGRATVRERVSLGEITYTYRVAADGFWQVHRQAPAYLVREVMRAIEAQAGETVLELYAGAGLFTQPLAGAIGSTGRLITLEGSRRAVTDARYNLRNIPWVDIENVAIKPKTLDHIDGYDLVVADPPRSGLGISLARQLADSGARRIVLLSCDPASMARDVAELSRADRAIRSIHAVDIFPNTHHFEVVTVLDRTM